MMDKQNILGFISMELLASKVHLLRFMKQKDLMEDPNLTRRLVKLLKAIEAIDNLNIYNQTYFEGDKDGKK
jgi:hypothetical protein